MKTALNIPTNNTNNNLVVKIKIAALIIVTLLSLSYKGSCADSTSLVKSKHAVYLCLTTGTSQPSLNYEHIFRQGRSFSYSYSAGFTAKGKDVFVPLSVDAFTTAKQHHLDISLGFTPFTEQHMYAKKKADTDKKMMVHPAIGYRYQKAAGGVFFKAGIGPQVLIDPPAYHVVAASVALVKPAAQIALGFSF